MVTRMTPEQIAVEYLRREKEGNATMKGADAQQIIKDMSQEYGLYWSEIKQAILDHTIAGPC